MGKLRISDGIDVHYGSITASGGIDGLDINNGISGSNYNISGVNALTINDPGEGIIFGGGSTTVTLYAIDDSTDSIMNFSNASELRVNGNKVWHVGNDGPSSGLDADTLDGQHASAFVSTSTTSLSNYMRVNASNNVSSSTYKTRWYSSSAINTSTGSASSLEVYGNNGAGTDAFMTFHVENDYAIYFGLDGGTNKLSVGGWSMGANSYEIYHSGNKPSLATLGFTGASNANYITNNNQLTNGANYITTSAIGTYIGKNRPNNYVASSTSTSNRGNFGEGIWAYSGYSTGTNRPFTYDATLQVMPDTSLGFELSIDWVSQSSTPIKIRSLRDCCQGWSNYSTIWTSSTDGSGSGLDADLLDGLHASSFARTSATASINMNNFSISNMNDLSFNDPGVQEGIKWNGGSLWQIYESPDGQTNAAGNLQFTSGSGNGTRRMTLDTSGNLEVISGDIKMASKAVLGESSGTVSVGDVAENDNIVAVDLKAWGGNGRIYIGDGEIWFNGTTDSNADCKINTSGAFHSNNDVVAYSTSISSDIKLKENIEPIQSGLDKILKLEGVSFDWKDEKRDKNQLGFIAQDVEEVLPELVKEVETLGTKDETHKVVNYDGVIPVLVEAIKEQQEIINKLTSRINDIEKGE